MNKQVNIVYTNYNGVTRLRRILPKVMFWGCNEYHQEMQWLLLATDLDINEERVFAMKDILNWS